VTQYSAAIWIALAACVALALFVHRRSLGTFFSPDDLGSIARARGLIPPHPVPFWRFLAGPGYFAFALRAFGTDPLPYHVVNWLLHALDVALLFLLARRWSGSLIAATVAAGLFGASRLAVAALLQSIGVGELMATAFVLALFLSFAPGLRGVLVSALLFAAALLSKETILLLPIVLLIAPIDGAPLRARIPAVAVMLGEGALFLVAFAHAGGRVSAFGGPAYETAFGLNLLQNLTTYASWIGDMRTLVPDLAGAPVAASWPAGLAVLLALSAIAALAWRRTRLPAIGIAWLALALAPVLPLLHHSYLQYLYPGFPGLALALGSGWAALLERLLGRSQRSGSRDRDDRDRGRGAGARSAARDTRHTRRSSRTPAVAAAWAASIALIAVHAFASDSLMAKRWASRLPGVELHSDPYLRKSEIVEHLSRSLAPAIAGRRARLVFVMPAESMTRVNVATGQVVAASGEQHNYLRSLLDDGRALKALHTEVDSVAFVDKWSPAFRDFDVIVNGPNGEAIDLGRGPVAHMRLASLLISGGHPLAAVENLDQAMTVYPGNSGLLLTHAFALARGGDLDRAAEEARSLLASAAGDTIAAEARGLLAQIERARAAR
jgi:hypothetical protein